MLKFLILSFIFLQSIYAKDCKYEYKHYQNLKNGWSLRINDKTNEYGCGILKIYSFIEKNDLVYMADAIDENPKLLAEIQKLFKNSQVLKILLKDKNAKEILISNSGNWQFLKNLNYLFSKKLNFAVSKEIKNNPVAINYFIFAASNSNNKEEIIATYNKLKRLTIDRLGFFTNIYTALSGEYKFDLLLENFLTLKQELTKQQLKETTSYPIQFAYFLYPSRVDLGYRGSDLLNRQKDFQKLMIHIYKDSYNKFGNTQTSLRIMEEIFPYIVQSENHKGYIKIFNMLFQKGFMDSLVTEDICGKSFKHNFIVFADKNLDKLIELRDNQNTIYRSLVDSNSESKNINALLYVANANSHFRRDKLEVFNSLLQHLSSDIYINALILKRLEGIKYFTNIVSQSDYKYYVKGNENDQANSSQKFKFILETDVLGRHSEPVMSLLYKNNLTEAKNKLDRLYNLPISKLKETDGEKYERWVDTTGNVVDVASIALIPFTGGFSELAGEALNKAMTAGAKYGVKRYAKVIGKKYLRNSMRISRSRGSKIMRQGIKVREGVEKTFGKKNLQSFSNGLDKINDKLGTFTVASEIGGAIFVLSPAPSVAKSICGEK